MSWTISNYQGSGWKSKLFDEQAVLFLLAYDHNTKCWCNTMYRCFLFFALALARSLYTFNCFTCNQLGISLAAEFKGVLAFVWSVQGASKLCLKNLTFYVSCILLQLLMLCRDFSISDLLQLMLLLCTHVDDWRKTLLHFPCDLPFCITFLLWWCVIEWCVMIILSVFRWCVQVGPHAFLQKGCPRVFRENWNRTAWGSNGLQSEPLFFFQAF